MTIRRHSKNNLLGIRALLLVLELCTSKCHVANKGYRALENNVAATAFGKDIKQSEEATYGSTLSLVSSETLKLVN